MNQPERKLQQAVMTYLDSALRPPAFAFHVPNGGKRTIREAVAFKRMGVKAGVPDIFVIAPDAIVALEMKAPRGGVSDAQKTMLGRLRECGVHTAVCKSLADVEAALGLAGISLRASA